MNLSPWRIALAILAVLVLAVAILDATAPAVPASCTAAESSRTNGLVTQAQEEYAAILAGEPSSSCAHRGMKRVGAALCRLGNKLVVHGADVAAARLYSSILLEQPVNFANRNCAARGLRDAHAQTGSVAYPCPAHAATAHATCTVTVGAGASTTDKNDKPNKRRPNWSPNPKRHDRHRHCRRTHRRGGDTDTP